VERGISVRLLGNMLIYRMICAFEPSIYLNNYVSNTLFNMY
jgi:hypothetical protein